MTTWSHHSTWTPQAITMSSRWLQGINWNIRENIIGHQWSTGIYLKDGTVSFSWLLSQYALCLTQGEIMLAWEISYDFYVLIWLLILPLHSHILAQWKSRMASVFFILRKTLINSLVKELKYSSVPQPQAHTYNPFLCIYNLFFFILGYTVTFQNYINLGHGYSNTYRIRALCSFCLVT